MVFSKELSENPQDFRNLLKFHGKENCLASKIIIRYIAVDWRNRIVGLIRRNKIGVVWKPVLLIDGAVTKK